jgi:hypothetical protein
MLAGPNFYKSNENIWNGPVLGLAALLIGIESGCIEKKSIPVSFFL